MLRTTLALVIAVTSLGLLAAQGLAAGNGKIKICGQKHGPETAWRVQIPGSKTFRFKGSTWTVFTHRTPCSFAAEGGAGTPEAVGKGEAGSLLDATPLGLRQEPVARVFRIREELGTHWLRGAEGPNHRHRDVRTDHAGSDQADHCDREASLASRRGRNAADGRWDALYAERTRGEVGEGSRRARAPRPARPDLVRGRLPRSADVPARACGRGALRVRRGGRGERVPVRADPGLAGRAERVRRADRGRPRPSARRRRAPRDERCDRGTGARWQVLPRLRRRRRGRGADLPRRDPVVPDLRGRRRGGPARRGRAAGGRARAALAGGLRPKLLYTIPEHQNPAGVSLTPERRRCSSSSRGGTAS